MCFLVTNYQVGIEANPIIPRNFLSALVKRFQPRNAFKSNNHHHQQEHPFGSPLQGGLTPQFGGGSPLKPAKRPPRQLPGYGNSAPAPSNYGSAAPAPSNYGSAAPAPSNYGSSAPAPSNYGGGSSGGGDSYGSPAAPALNSNQDSYGSPAAPALNSGGDSYGSPAAPAISSGGDSYGSPAAPALNSGDSYGSPAAPALNSAPDSYGSPAAPVQNSYNSPAPSAPIASYGQPQENCEVIRSLTRVGNDCQQGGQECDSQCTTTQEEVCETKYETQCRTVNEQVKNLETDLFR